MKLIKQILLHYYNPSVNSDKVYNVYVYEKSPTQYIVNTEYGRRGKGLTTTADITFSNQQNAIIKAQSIADSKTKKGYDDISTPISRQIEKFNDQYLKQLKISAAFLCAEGIIERNHYNNLKSLLDSGNEENQTMAEQLIIAKESSLNAA